MHIVIRLIITLLASVLGFVSGFGAIALVFLVLHIDAGIGGGLIALLAGNRSYDSNSSSSTRRFERGRQCSRTNGPS